MATPWLFVAVSGLLVTTVFSQIDNPPTDLPVTGVRLYQGLLDRPIPNYAMVAARDFADKDKGTESLQFLGVDDDVNDGLWCQSANPGNDIGSWQLPNGNLVPADLNAKPVHMANTPGQVGLLRNGGISLSPYQGMYTCTIPDENGVIQTLVVWAGGNDAYDGNTTLNPNIPHPLIEDETLFIPSKPRDTDPPELILSFDVKVAPPTYVTCHIDNTNVDVADLSREVISGEYFSTSTPSPVTNVTVTLRTRQAGNYQCTVSVFRASMLGTTNPLNNATTSPISITVTDTPTNVNCMRTGLYTVKVSWTVPATNTPSITGYEVFYTESGSDVTGSGGTTTSTTTTFIVTLPKLGVIYNLFVVAFSDADNTLPSVRSGNSTINLNMVWLTAPLSIISTTSDRIMVSWMAPQFPPTGYVTTSVCTLLCSDLLLYPIVTATTSSSTSVTFFNLPPGSECNITLAAQDGSVLSNELMVTATTMSEQPASAPNGFAVVSVNSSSVTLTWNDLMCFDRNGPLLGYVIEYAPDGGTSSSTFLAGSNQLTGLNACTNYTLSIAAKNDAGIGDFSLPLSVITNETGIPGPVIFNQTSALILELNFL